MSGFLITVSQNRYAFGCREICERVRDDRLVRIRYGYSSRTLCRTERLIPTNTPSPMLTDTPTPTRTGYTRCQRQPTHRRLPTDTPTPTRTHTPTPMPRTADTSFTPAETLDAHADGYRTPTPIRHTPMPTLPARSSQLQPAQCDCAEGTSVRSASRRWVETAGAISGQKTPYDPV